LVAEEKRMMETMNRMHEPPVIDPDAPTVTVVDFDKTAQEGADENRQLDDPVHGSIVCAPPGTVPRISDASAPERIRPSPPTEVTQGVALRVFI
jgi:hypothetical protein